MAEKLKNGIGRELRYMEYKLRKKRSDWDKDKKKVKQNQYDKAYPSMKEFEGGDYSSEIKSAMPSTTGEEDLQLQVALAMSKEEVSEQEKQERSDKLRLELALKESASMAEKAEAKIKQNTAETSKSASDPWGNSSAVPTQPKEGNFMDDLFANEASTSSSSSGFQKESWDQGFPGTAMPSQPAPSAAANPWATTSSTPVVLAPPQKSPMRQAAPSFAETSPQPLQSHQDLLGSNLNANPTDPWGASTPAATNGFTTPQSADELDPFATLSMPTSSNATTPLAGIESIQPSDDIKFDPLADFDQLHLQAPISQPAATPALDLMTPTPINAQPSSAFMPSPSFEANPAASSDRAGMFLGTNTSLVDIDQLVAKPSAANPPYMMNMTAQSSQQLGAARNPFWQKGPSMSLNQMKSVGQPAFGADQQQSQQPMAQNSMSAFHQPPANMGYPAMTPSAHSMQGLVPVPAVSGQNLFASNDQSLF